MAELREEARQGAQGTQWPSSGRGRTGDSTVKATEGSASTNKTQCAAERSRYPAPPPDGIGEKSGRVKHETESYMWVWTPTS